MKQNMFSPILRKPLSVHGFTLVELMLAITISMIIGTTIYSAYSSQRLTQVAQEQVTEMQQNLRAAMLTIVRDVRMAGYDPTSEAGAGITIASAGQISISQDITGGENDTIDNDGDGITDEADEARYGNGNTLDTGEQVDLGFSLANDVLRDGIPDIDRDGDGVPDAQSLGRQVGGAGGYQVFADNIQAIELNYLDEFDNVTAVPEDIRAVQISILARASGPDPKVNNTAIYTAASGNTWGPYNDNYRRRLLITRVTCRNMGI